ncbi:hypothetical protein ACFWN2_44690 [Lentzea sp. NPDC058436]|uniref:scabin-related ADP-ribosyltransferase n=1 Tax=Lentzea sp. NPDC058436 TaxID=3346499 RepID=UPI0036545274
MPGPVASQMTAVPPRPATTGAEQARSAASPGPGQVARGTTVSTGAMGQGTAAAGTDSTGTADRGQPAAPPSATDSPATSADSAVTWSDGPAVSADSRVTSAEAQTASVDAHTSPTDSQATSTGHGTTSVSPPGQAGAAEPAEAVTGTPASAQHSAPGSHTVAVSQATDIAATLDDPSTASAPSVASDGVSRDSVTAASESYSRDSATPASDGYAAPDRTTSGSVAAEVPATADPVYAAAPSLAADPLRANDSADAHAPIAGFELAPPALRTDLSTGLDQLRGDSPAPTFDGRHETFPRTPMDAWGNHQQALTGLAAAQREVAAVQRRRDFSSTPAPAEREAAAIDGLVAAQSAVLQAERDLVAWNLSPRQVIALHQDLLARHPEVGGGAYGAPVADRPVESPPEVEAPEGDMTAVEAPAVEAPEFEAPTVEAPAVEAPAAVVASSQHERQPTPEPPLDPVPLDELLRDAHLFTDEHGPLVLALPVAPRNIGLSSVDLNGLTGGLGPGEVAVTARVRGGRIEVGGREVSADTVARVIAAKTPGRRVVLTMPGAEQVASSLREFLGENVTVLTDGQTIDPSETAVAPEAVVVPDARVVNPAITTVGVPRAGLPGIAELVDVLRSGSADVPDSAWHRLHQDLLSNYRYVAQPKGSSSVTGLLRRIGDDEVLISLEVEHVRVVDRPAGAYQDGAEAETHNFTAVGTVNSVFRLGAYQQVHAGQTATTAVNLNLGFGIGLGAGPLQLVSVGGDASFVFNQSNRSTRRIIDAEGGHVEDNRSPHTLVENRARWVVRRRSSPESWANVPATPVGVPAPLLLWTASHYLETPGPQSTAPGVPAELRRGLPSYYFAYGLSNVPLLHDSIAEVLRDNGVSMRPADLTWGELAQKLANLDANLDRAVNDPRGYEFELRDDRGRLIATVSLRAVREDQAQPVGVATDRSHLEDVRTFIDGTGGDHVVSHSWEANANTTLGLRDLNGSDAGLNLTVSAGLTASRSDSVSTAQNGLWVLVPRYSGRTAAYSMDFTVTARVRVRGGDYLITPQTEPVPVSATVRMPETAALEHGLPVDAALSTVPLPVRPVGHPRTVVRAALTGRADPPEPSLLSRGRGIGTGIVEIDQSTVDGLLELLVPALQEHGFLPPGEDYLRDHRWWSHGQALNSVHENHMLLHKVLSRNGIESGWDLLHQDGLTFTLQRRKGFAGITTDLDSAKITLTARQSPEVTYLGENDDFHAVNLGMGMGVFGFSTRASRKFSVKARLAALLGANWQLGMGGGYARSYAAGNTSEMLTNRPELLEFPGTLDVYAMSSDFTATIEYQHSGPRGHVLTGRRDPDPFELHDQSSLALLIPLDGDGDLSGRRSTTPPRSILTHGAVYHLDSFGVRPVLRTMLDDLAGPAGYADQEINTFSSSIVLRAFLKEIVNGEFTSDQFFEPGLVYDTHAVADISATLGGTTFVGSTKSKFVLGVIKLSLQIASDNSSRGTGWTWDQFDLTYGRTDEGVNGTVGGTASRAWGQNTSRSLSRTGGEEYIQLDFNRAYAFESEVVFDVAAKLERHAKLKVWSGDDGRREPVTGRARFVLSEPEALARHARGDLVVSDEQLGDAMTRWEHDEVALSGSLVAGVLTRWARDTPDRDDELANRLLNWALLLEQRHATGGLHTVSDPARRTSLREVFDLRLAEDDPFAGLMMPRYLTNPNTQNNFLGFTGVHDVEFRHHEGSGTTSLFAQARALVDEVAPGLLSADPHVVGAGGDLVGRLQGGVTALQAVLAKGRDDALWGELLSANGVVLYLVNQVGWVLSDVVEIRLTGTLTSLPEVVDQLPNAGLEKYDHAYSAESSGRSRDGAQSFSLKGSAGDTRGSGRAAARFAEGHHRGTTRAETQIAEQTAYDWSGKYLVSIGQQVTISVRRLDMNGRPINNALLRAARRFPNLVASGDAREITVRGTIDLQMPKSVLEGRPIAGPRPRTFLPAPALPGDATVTGVLLDDLLPTATALLRDVLGPSGGDPDRHVSLNPSVVLARSHLSAHLHEATAGNRYLLSAELIVPGRPADRVALWLEGDLYDVEEVAALRGTGTGRYSKSQESTSANASFDHWRLGLDAGGSATAHMNEEAGHQFTPSTSQGRVLPSSQASTDNVNLRREQHVKQFADAAGPSADDGAGGAAPGDGEVVVMARFRGRFRVVAEGRNHGLFHQPKVTGRFASEFATGDVYTHVFRSELQSMLSRQTSPEPQAPPPVVRRTLPGITRRAVRDVVTDLLPTARDLHRQDRRPVVVVVGHTRDTAGVAGRALARELGERLEGTGIELSDVDIRVRGTGRPLDGVAATVLLTAQDEHGLLRGLPDLTTPVDLTAEFRDLAANGGTAFQAGEVIASRVRARLGTDLPVTLELDRAGLHTDLLPPVLRWAADQVRTGDVRLAARYDDLAADPGRLLGEKTGPDDLLDDVLAQVRRVRDLHRAGDLPPLPHQVALLALSPDALAREIAFELGTSVRVIETALDGTVTTWRAAPHEERPGAVEDVSVERPPAADVDKPLPPLPPSDDRSALARPVTRYGRDLSALLEAVTAATSLTPEAGVPVLLEVDRAALDRALLAPVLQWAADRVRAASPGRADLDLAELYDRVATDPRGLSDPVGAVAVVLEHIGLVGEPPGVAGLPAQARFLLSTSDELVREIGLELGAPMRIRGELNGDRTAVDQLLADGQSAPPQTGRAVRLLESRSAVRQLFEPGGGEVREQDVLAALTRGATRPERFRPHPQVLGPDFFARRTPPLPRGDRSILSADALPTLDLAENDEIAALPAPLRQGRKPAGAAVTRLRHAVDDGRPVADLAELGRFAERTRQDARVVLWTRHTRSEVTAGRGADLAAWAGEHGVVLLPVDEVFGRGDMELREYYDAFSDDITAGGQAQARRLLGHEAAHRFGGDLVDLSGEVTVPDIGRSWLRETYEPGRWAGGEPVAGTGLPGDANDVAERLVQTLAHRLFTHRAAGRTGPLRVGDVVDALSVHQHAAAIWRAATEFLARQPETRHLAADLLAEADLSRPGEVVGVTRDGRDGPDDARDGRGDAADGPGDFADVPGGAGAPGVGKSGHSGTENLAAAPEPRRDSPHRDSPRPAPVRGVRQVRFADESPTTPHPPVTSVVDEAVTDLGRAGWAEGEAVQLLDPSGADVAGALSRRLGGATVYYARDSRPDERTDDVVAPAWHRAGPETPHGTDLDGRLTALTPAGVHDLPGYLRANTTLGLAQQRKDLTMPFAAALDGMLPSGAREGVEEFVKALRTDIGRFLGAGHSADVVVDGRRYELRGRARFDWGGAVTGESSTSSAGLTGPGRGGTLSASVGARQENRAMLLIIVPTAPGLSVVGTVGFSTDASNVVTSSNDAAVSTTRELKLEVPARAVAVPVQVELTLLDARQRPIGDVEEVGGTAELVVPVGLGDVEGVTGRPGTRSYVESVAIRGTTPGLQRGRRLPPGADGGHRLFDQVAAALPRSLVKPGSEGRRVLREFLGGDTVRRRYHDLAVSREDAALGRGWVRSEMLFTGAHPLLSWFDTPSAVEMRLVERGEPRVLQTLPDVEFDAVTSVGTSTSATGEAGRALDVRAMVGPGFDEGSLGVVAGVVVAGGTGRGRHQEIQRSGRVTGQTSRRGPAQRQERRFDLEVRVPGRPAMTFPDDVGVVEWVEPASRQPEIASPQPARHLYGPEALESGRALAGASLEHSGVADRLLELIENSVRTVPGHRRWYLSSGRFLEQFPDASARRTLGRRLRHGLGRRDALRGLLTDDGLSLLAERALSQDGLRIPLVPEHGWLHDHHVSFTVRAAMSDLRDTGDVTTPAGPEVLTVTDDTGAEHRTTSRKTVGGGVMSRITAALAGRAAVLVTALHTTFTWTRSGLSGITTRRAEQREVGRTPDGASPAPEPAHRFTANVEWTVTGTSTRRHNAVVRGMSFGRPGLHVPETRPIDLVDPATGDTAREAGIRVEADVLVPAAHVSRTRPDPVPVTRTEGEVNVPGLGLRPAPDGPDLLRDGLSRDLDGIRVVGFGGLEHVRAAVRNALFLASGDPVFSFPETDNSTLVENVLSPDAVRADQRLFSRTTGFHGLSWPRRRLKQFAAAEVSFVPLEVERLSGERWQRVTETTTTGSASGAGSRVDWNATGVVDTTAFGFYRDVAPGDLVAKPGALVVLEHNPLMLDGTSTRESGTTVTTGTTLARPAERLHLVRFGVRVSVAAEVRSRRWRHAWGFRRPGDPGTANERFEMPRAVTAWVTTAQLDALRARQAKATAPARDSLSVRGNLPAKDVDATVRAPDSLSLDGNRSATDLDATVPALSVEGSRPATDLDATVPAPAFLRPGRPVRLGIGAVDGVVDLRSVLPELRRDLARVLGPARAARLVPSSPLSQGNDNYAMIMEWLADAQTSLEDSPGGVPRPLRLEDRLRGETYELVVSNELLAEPEFTGLTEGGLRQTRTTVSLGTRIRGFTRTAWRLEPVVLPAVQLGGAAPNENISRSNPFSTIGGGLIGDVVLGRRKRTRKDARKIVRERTAETSGPLASYRAQVGFTVSVERHGRQIAEARAERELRLLHLPEDEMTGVRAVTSTPAVQPAGQAAPEEITRWRGERSFGSGWVSRVEADLDALVDAAETAYREATGVGHVPSEVRRSLRAQLSGARFKALLPAGAADGVRLDLPAGSGITLDLHVRRRAEPVLTGVTARTAVSTKDTGSVTRSVREAAEMEVGLARAAIAGIGGTQPPGYEHVGDRQYFGGGSGLAASIDPIGGVASEGEAEAEETHDLSSSTSRAAGDLTGLWSHDLDVRFVARPTARLTRRGPAVVDVSVDNAVVVADDTLPDRIPAGLAAAARALTTAGDGWWEAYRAYRTELAKLGAGRAAVEGSRRDRLVTDGSGIDRLVPVDGDADHATPAGSAVDHLSSAQPTSADEAPAATFPAPVTRTTTEPLYALDFRAPDDVREEGFPPPGGRLDLYEYLASPETSGHVAFTRDRAEALDHGLGRHLYVVTVPGGVDVAATIARYEGPHRQAPAHVLFPEGIAPEHVTVQDAADHPVRNREVKVRRALRAEAAAVEPGTFQVSREHRLVHLTAEPDTSLTEGLRQVAVALHTYVSVDANGRVTSERPPVPHFSPDLIVLVVDDATALHSVLDSALVDGLGAPDAPVVLVGRAAGTGLAREIAARLPGRTVVHATGPSGVRAEDGAYWVEDGAEFAVLADGDALSTVDAFSRR